MKPDNKPWLDVVGVRLVPETRLMSDRDISSPDDAMILFSDTMKDLDREVIMAVYLRPDKKPICASVVSVGTLGNAILHPREVFKAAFLCNAESFILLHNHPSGGHVSSKDIELTNRLIECGNILGIPLIDHIVVQGRTGKYTSIMAEGLCSFSPDTGSSIAAQDSESYTTR